MKTNVSSALLALPLLAALQLPASAQLASGTILVTDAGSGTNALGQLLAVAPGTSNKTVFSDFANSAQGPLGAVPASVVVVPMLLSPPLIVVADYAAGTGSNGALFKVDPRTGNRTILSDFGNSGQGPPGVDPINVVFDTGLLGLGTGLWVLDNEAGTNSHGAVFPSIRGPGNAPSSAIWAIPLRDPRALSPPTSFPCRVVLA
jgi:hypothetical protein